MRILLAMLASLVFTACGGLGDEGLPQTPAAQTPGLGGLPAPPQGTELEEALPTPEVPWEVIWGPKRDPLQLEQTPVEERFFYPVDVNRPPPELPPPACPVCS